MKNFFYIKILCLLIYSKISAQNVGIGTTTPADKLSIVSLGYGVTHTNGPVTMGTFISNLNAQFGTKTNHPLQFFTNNGNAQMTILQNGKVGIGSELPTEKLNIVGNVLSEGNVAGFRFNDRADNAKGYQWYSTGGNAHLYRVQAPAGNAISVLENGNIGFNTSTPQTNLHMNPNGAGSILIGTNKNGGGYTNLEMGISTQSNGFGYIQTTKASGSAYGTLQLNPSGGDVTVTGKVEIGGNATVAGMVGIGTTTPFYPLDIVQNTNGYETKALRILSTESDGTNHNWSFGTWFNLFLFHNNVVRTIFDRNDGTIASFSDKRLKKNIIDVSPMLAKVVQLKVKNYQILNSDDPNKTTTGLISQEVLPLFPEFVKEFKNNTKDTTTYYAINYAGLSVVAIKAIQEQQVIIENQQKAIDKLTAQNIFILGEIEKLNAPIASIQVNK